MNWPDSLAQYRAALVDKGIEPIIADRVIDTLVELRGGGILHVPACQDRQRAERNDLIRAQSKVMSKRAIAKQHKLSIRTIERIISR